MSKLSYGSNQTLRPINKQTLKALGWAEKDHELKTKAAPPLERKLEIKFPGQIIKCPKCDSPVMAKNMEKHYKKMHPTAT